MGFGQRSMPRRWRSGWVGRGGCQSSSALTLFGAVLVFWCRRRLKWYAHYLLFYLIFFSFLKRKFFFAKRLLSLARFCCLTNEMGTLCLWHFFIFKVEKIEHQLSIISCPSLKVWGSKEVVALGMVAPSSTALAHFLSLRLVLSSAPPPLSHFYLVIMVLIILSIVLPMTAKTTSTLFPEPYLPCRRVRFPWPHSWICRCGQCIPPISSFLFFPSFIPLLLFNIIVSICFIPFFGLGDWKVWAASP